MNRRIDLVGIFRLDAANGRTAPAFSGSYRPVHKLHDNYLSSGTHVYPDQESVSPGESVPVEVMLVSPEVYPGSLWVGRIVEVYEGSRRVGQVEVTEVRNTVLLGNPADFQSTWSPPPTLR